MIRSQSMVRKAELMPLGLVALRRKMMKLRSEGKMLTQKWMREKKMKTIEPRKRRQSNVAPLSLHHHLPLMTPLSLSLMIHTCQRRAIIRTALIKILLRPVQFRAPTWTTFLRQ